MKKPNITIVIATFNSGIFLVETLKAIQKQIFLEEVVLEILFCDGGSTDNTLAIAQDNGCKVLKNINGDAIHAKQLGLTNAAGQYVLFLDHDEVLVNSKSISNKYVALKENEGIIACMSSGYLNSHEQQGSNIYASAYGDPFSAYFYAFPNDSKLRKTEVRKRFRTTPSSKGALVVDVGSERRPTLMELVAGATLIRKDFFLSNFPRLYDDHNLIPHLYSLACELDGDHYIAIMEDDEIIHSGTSSWKQVAQKVRWRVDNATHDPQNLGASGLRGRLNLDSRRVGNLLIAILFVIEAIAIIPLSIRTVRLMFVYRKFSLAGHFAMTYLVIFAIIQNYLTGLFNLGPRSKRYDGRNL